MKRILSTIAALFAAASPAMAGTAWQYEGEEGRLSHFDVYGNDNLHLVVHHRNARWISSDRLRVEFSLRANADDTMENRTWMPYVMYDEQGRCDHKDVCDPPLYPVVNYASPLEYRTESSGRFLVHSFTLDCKNAPYAQFRNSFNYEVQLNMTSICEYHR